MFIDARIPVRFLSQVPERGRSDHLLLLAGEQSGPGGEVGDQGWAAVLALSEPPGQGASLHAPSCACCVARSPWAAELTRLFHGRARGETRFFKEAVAVLADPAAARLRAVMRSDPFIRGCFVEAY